MTTTEPDAVESAVDPDAETGKAAERPFWRRPLVLALVPVVLLAVAASVFALTTNPRSWYIPSASMEPTLNIGDRVLTWSLGDVERGDLVVVDARLMDAPLSSDHLITRVIGLPGETVSFENEQVLIDGLPLDEPYITGSASVWPDSFDVPADHVLVLGDNRIASLDSRSFGPVPLDAIVSNNAWVWRSG